MLVINIKRQTAGKERDNLDECARLSLRAAWGFMLPAV